MSTSISVHRITSVQFRETRKVASDCYSASVILTDEDGHRLELTVFSANQNVTDFFAGTVTSLKD